ncbi:MAG: DUF3108 domain-containing protein [Elusimicrobiota bacterium]
MLRIGLLRTQIDINWSRRLIQIFVYVICVFYLCNVCSAENTKLPPEEKLVYDVYWKLVKVGYSTLEIKGIVDFNGQKAYHFYSEAKSAPFFGTFFKVRDFTNSWVDVEKFHSITFEHHISEGRYKRNRRIVYDQNKHLATNSKGESFEILENALDVLASLYLVRLQEIKPKNTFTLNVNSNKKNYKMKVVVHDRETIMINEQKYETILVEPDLQDAGIFMNKGRVLIWMTDDEYHIPVKMTSKIAIGSIVAKLNTSAVAPLR